MKKTLLAISLTLTVLNSSELDTSFLKNIQKTIKEDDLKFINEINFNDPKNKSTQSEDKTKDDIYTKSYKSFTEALKMFNNTSNIQKFIDVKYKEKIEQYEGSKDGLTIIYFMSEDLPRVSVKRFIEQAKVLSSHYENMHTRIFMNNYPLSLVDTIKGKKEGKFIPLTKKSNNGIITIDEDGNYVFKVNSIVLEANKKIIENIAIEDKNKQLHVITIKLRTNHKGILKIEGKFSMDTMKKYVNSLKELGLKNAKTKLHVHPWAFNEIGLNHAPAFLLAKCDNNDFKFKSCDKKYLLSGDVTLEYFLQTLASSEPSYEEYYQSYMKGLKYD